nr:retrotransposon protein, putative, Ty1-copia subclass [Tanacetum cinerariifolium]
GLEYGRYDVSKLLDTTYRGFLGAHIRRIFLDGYGVLVVRTTGRTVKKLRTDNGLELCNREFEQLCIESGIARHLTVVGMSQQNRLAERHHRQRLRKITPMEMWSGHPSDYGMLRIFGCVIYSHVKQGKLEPREVKCILLGYPEGVKGYRLYRFDGESPKIVTSKNMVFNESAMYKDAFKDSDANQDDGNDEDSGYQETDQTLDLTDYQLTRDREPRIRTKPLRFQNESNMAAYVFAAAEEEDTHEPLTYQEAVACEDNPPAGQKLVSSKWLFKIKEGIECVQKPRYKARLVARGFTQRVGIDCNEVFSLVVRHTSIRVILALTACKDYVLEQLDVKTAFLHGNLEETTFLHGNLEEVIYMRQPSGYEQGNKVCLLKKSLYGLKQSPRQWYRRFDEYMLSNGFKRSSYDNYIYYRSYAPSEYIYLLLYVDDMLIACKSKAEIGSTKCLLKREFDMKELGEAKKILAKAVLMANLLSCDPEVLYEVSYSKSYPNDMINYDVQEMQYSEQTHVDDFEDNEIYSGSNIIMYS